MNKMLPKPRECTDAGAVGSDAPRSVSFLEPPLAELRQELLRRYVCASIPRARVRNLQSRLRFNRPLHVYRRAQACIPTYGTDEPSGPSQAELDTVLMELRRGVKRAVSEWSAEMRPPPLLQALTKAAEQPKSGSRRFERPTPTHVKRKRTAQAPSSSTHKLQPDVRNGPEARVPSDTRSKTPRTLGNGELGVTRAKALSGGGGVGTMVSDDEDYNGDGGAAHVCVCHHDVFAWPPEGELDDNGDAGVIVRGGLRHS